MLDPLFRHRGFFSDDTRHIVPHGDPPTGNTLAFAELASIHAERLGALACGGWKPLACKHPVLDVVVDRCTEGEGLAPSDVLPRLTRLLCRHANDWDAARPVLAKGELTSLEPPA